MISQIQEEVEDVEDSLEDVFGRSLEQQLQDNIVWRYWVDQDLHRIHEEYVSDDNLQDGDAPFGMYLTSERGSPEFEIEEPYLAPWHRDKQIELLEEGYDHAVEYWD